MPGVCRRQQAREQLVKAWSAKLDYHNQPVQAVEFTPDKKIVWVLRRWEESRLGPATRLILASDARAREGDLGEFK